MRGSGEGTLCKLWSRGSSKMRKIPYKYEKVSAYATLEPLGGPPSRPEWQEYAL